MTNTLTITTNSYDATIDQDSYTVTIGAAVTSTKAVHTENFTISALNATGTDGATGRVVTLSNTATSKDDGLLVILDHQFVHPGQITTSHLSASSTITFTNVRVWNGQLLTVIYHDA